ncbi:MAG: hypothetical protein Q8P17_01585 [bacterium]|nr:hypothetical protein [bacterium]
MRLSLFTTLTFALLLPLAASAQSLGDLGGTDSFTVSVTPQYPTPYSSATLSFLSISLDLANATLSLSVGGKNIYKGAVRPVAVPLGKAGSVTNVAATISSGGANYSQSLSLQPQDVALVVEPISSAPPLYPGKPLVPLEGDVRVVAVANLKSSGGKSLDPSVLSYTWTVDNTRIANSSGIGKMAIIVASPLQYRARDVSVAVTSQDGSLVGGALLSLSPIEPSVRIYENDPLLGILYDHVLSDSYSITGTESTLFAAPFSLPTTIGAPFVQWFLNGSVAQTGNSITLRPTGSGQGNASLSLTASAGNNTTATANLSLIFGATSNSNFFGL